MSHYPSIEFNSVTVSYKGKKETTVALKDFSLKVRKGETVALLGPSGSGKSTVLKALSGFTPVTTGTIKLDNNEITNLPPEKRNIGVVVQSYALFPHMNVMENIKFGVKANRKTRSLADETAEEMLNLVGLAKYKDRFPKELSGGQKQRVAIARALAIKPPVLLLDEPLAALDVSLKQEMLNQLKQLKENLPDTTILYVTHDQSEANTLADRTVIMNNSEIVDIGTPKELWNHPPSEFTAQFLGGTNIFKGQVTKTNPLTISANGYTFKAQTKKPESITLDKPVTLTIRPQHIKIHESSIGQDNIIKATIKEAVWKGHTSHLKLEIPGWLDGVTAEVATDHPSINNETVDISFDENKIMVL